SERKAAAATAAAGPGRMNRTRDEGSRMAAVGYVAVVRDNPAFRRLWNGQVCSQVGDWLDAIALYALLLRLTGSAAALAGQAQQQGVQGDGVESVPHLAAHL